MRRTWWPQIDGLPLVVDGVPILVDDAPAAERLAAWFAEDRPWRLRLWIDPPLGTDKVCVFTAAEAGQISG